VARISGLPELERTSLSHALNMKAVARKVAKEMGKKYEDVNFVVAHLGTGVSVTPHKRGRMVDVNNAKEEGPFSPDRCGGLPAGQLVKLCYSGKYTYEEMREKLTSKGGLYAYLGTTDLREVEKMADQGHELANLLLDALAYQVAKEIGAMAAVLEGDVDRIIITGGIAHSVRIVNDIIKRVKFIAPVVVVPGEEELESLALGALRVLRGEEEAKEYV
jgi:butyrate kinase